MNSSQLQTRLTKELREIENDPPHNVSVGIVKDNLLHWEAIIFGPTESPYSNGIFKLDIKFPNDYPFKPPIIKFVTKVYHPNIDKDGTICVDILKNQWSPALTIEKVLLSICDLLTTPNPNDPLNTDAARKYLDDIEEYNNYVRQYVAKYAQYSD